jgi:hypothetical protein
MTKKNSTAVLVAGMHRSGTSALAGALNMLGLSLGERLLSPGEDNPKGYWEHQGVVEIHERLLASLSRRWDDVRPLPAGWIDSEAARVAANEVRTMVSNEFAETHVWAVKDPRICRFLPLWIEVLRELDIRPVVLFACRKPSEVAASITSRNHWASPVGEMLWLRHVLEAERDSRGLTRTAVIYEDLLFDPVLTIASAMARLNVDIPKPAGEGDSALAKFIDSTDRHHAHDGVDENCSAFGLIAEVSYASLVDIAHGVNAWSQFEDHASRFESEWRHYGAYIEAMADMAYQFSAKEVSIQIEASRLASALNAQVQWSEEAVEIRRALEANYAELLNELEEKLVEVQQTRQELTHSRSEAELLKAQVEDITAQFEQSQTQVEQMLRSRSWRVTWVLRELERLFQRKGRLG